MRSGRGMTSRRKLCCFDGCRVPDPMCNRSKLWTPGGNRARPSCCTWLWLLCGHRVGSGRLGRAGPGREVVPRQVRSLPAALLPVAGAPTALCCTAPFLLWLGVSEMLQSSCPRRLRNIYVPPAHLPGSVQCPGPRTRSLGHRGDQDLRFEVACQ